MRARIVWVISAIVVIGAGLAIGLTAGRNTSPPVNEPFLIDDSSVGNNPFVTDENSVVFISQAENKHKIIQQDIRTNSKTILNNDDSSTPGFKYFDSFYSNEEYTCWFDIRNFKKNSPYDIYYKSITASDEIRVTGYPASRNSLTLLDNYLAYAEYGSEKPGIYIKDMSQNSEPSLIHALTSEKPVKLQIGKHENTYYVVYESANNNTYDINLYNVSTGSTLTISSSSEFNEMLPAIQNGFIYFSSFLSLPGQDELKSMYKASGFLYSYSIESKQMRAVMSFDHNELIRVVRNNNNANFAIISKTTLSNFASSSTLYAYNPLNSETIKVRENNSIIVPYSGCSSGDYVVYSTYSSSTSSDDIFLYDISRRTEKAIANTKHFETSARINGDLVVWCETSGDEKNPIQQLKGMIVR